MQQLCNSLKLIMFLNLKSESSHFLQVYSDGLSKEALLLGEARKIRSGIRSKKEGCLLLLVSKNAETSLTNYQTHHEDMQDGCSLTESGSSKSVQALIERGESE